MLEQANGESHGDRESGQEAVLWRKLFALARISFPALIFALVKGSGDREETCDHGDADCDGGGGGYDEASIESVGVREDRTQVQEGGLKLAYNKNFTHGPGVWIGDDFLITNFP